MKVEGELNTKLDKIIMSFINGKLDDYLELEAQAYKLMRKNTRNYLIMTKYSNLAEEIGKPIKKYEYILKDADELLKR